MSSDESDTEEETADDEEEDEEFCDSLSEDGISYLSAIGGRSYGICEEYGNSECGYYSVNTDTNSDLVYFNL